MVFMRKGRHSTRARRTSDDDADYQTADQSVRTSQSTADAGAARCWLLPDAYPGLRCSHLLLMVAPDTLWPSNPCTDTDATVMMGLQEGRRHASF